MSPCCMYLFCCPIQCFTLGNFRTDLRAKYNLPPGACGDCCIHCFCGHCAICQEAREIRFRMTGTAPAHHRI